jgi:hypothetical protein
VSRTLRSQDGGLPRANRRRSAQPPGRAAGRGTIASVKRTLAWLAGFAGIAALGRMLARRRHASETIAEAPAATVADDPAEELRRRLADQRQPEPEAASAPVAEMLEDETLDERRARVHAKAREAIDTMHDDEPAT